MFPASLLALARGQVDLALGASAVVTLLSSLRAFATGWVIEDALRRTWRRAVSAAQAQSVTELTTRRADDENVTLLIDAVRETALHDATMAPHMIALTLSLLAVAVTTAIVLGPLWVLLGVVALLLVGGFVVLGQSKLRPLQEKAWKDAGELALDVRVLCEASAELRAHGREDAFARELLVRVDGVAMAERSASMWASLVSLLPAGIALFALAAPVRAGLSWAKSAFALGNVAEVGVLGGTGLLIALGLARAVQTMVRSAPHRRALKTFLDRGAAANARRDERRTRDGANRDREEDSRARNDGAKGGSSGVDSHWIAPIRFEGVSYRHAPTQLPTPHRFDRTWSTGAGLAVTGENGSGKSTLALLLLGLLQPTEGRIAIGATPLGEADLDAYHRRVAYLPQNPFVAHGASVLWHLRLLTDAGGTAATTDAIDAALARVELLPVLLEHSERSGRHPHDVLVGELSGGERQRMHLARILLQDAELVVLDEPEAGLDEKGRALLRDLVDELSREKRVFLVAHDPSIVPDSFERVRLQREAHGAAQVGAASAE